MRFMRKKKKGEWYTSKDYVNIVKMKLFTPTKVGIIVVVHWGGL